MRSIFTTVFVGLTLTAVTADEIRPPSRIVAVDVQVDGAAVTRTVPVTARPGGTTIVLPDLPGDVDRASVRVRGEGGFVIGTVDTRVVPPDPRPANASDIERQIAALREQRAALESEAAAADSRRRLADVLINNPGLVGGRGEHAQPLSMERLGELAAFIETAHRAAGDRRMEVDRRRRAIDGEIAALERQLAVDPARRRPRLELRITVAPDGATPAQGRLHVEYRVQSARWTPVYDARLTTSGSKPQIEIVRRAIITQGSGETWDGVALTLSTARATGRVNAPELAALVVGWVPPAPAPAPRPLARERREALSAQDQPRGMIDPETQVAVPLGAGDTDRASAREADTTLVAGGLDVRFAVPGATTVAGTGDATNVRVETLAVEPALTAVVVPVLDTTAYLQGRFRNTSGAPLLPGRVLLYRDGVFAGNDMVRLALPGEEMLLGFGPDPRLKVTRTQPVRDAGSSGLLGNRWVETVESRVTIQNLGQAALTVRVLDRVPVSEVQDITVEPLPGATVPTERDVDGRRGVIAFAVEARPGQEAVIRAGWRISRPRDREIQEIERPIR